MKRKISKFRSCVKAKVSRVILNCNKEDLHDSSDTGEDTKEMPVINQKAKDLDVLVNLMKVKILTRDGTSIPAIPRYHRYWG